MNTKKNEIVSLKVEHEDKYFYQLCILMILFLNNALSLITPLITEKFKDPYLLFFLFLLIIEIIFVLNNYLKTYTYIIDGSKIYKQSSLYKSIYATTTRISRTEFVKNVNRSFCFYINEEECSIEEFNKYIKDIDLNLDFYSSSFSTDFPVRLFIFFSLLPGVIISYYLKW